MIKPILPFRAVVPGSAYPKNFSVEDEFEVNSVAAKAAFDLGCLSDEDRVKVSAVLGLAEDQTSAAAEKAAAEKAAAEKAAAEKAAAEKAAAEKAAVEKAAAEKAAAEKAAAEKAAAEKAAAEKKAQAAAPENKAGGAND